MFLNVYDVQQIIIRDWSNSIFCDQNILFHILNEPQSKNFNQT